MEEKWGHRYEGMRKKTTTLIYVFFLFFAPRLS